MIAYVLISSSLRGETNTVCIATEPTLHSLINILEPTLH